MRANKPPEPMRPRDNILKVTSAQWNRVWAAVRAVENISGVRRMGDRIEVPRQRATTISGSRRKETTVTIQRFRIKNFADHKDHLLCVTWDGVDEGNKQIPIAKPYLLRRTPFEGDDGRNGLTFEYITNTRRKAKRPVPDANPPRNEEETQIIIPGYVLNDEIYAVIGVEGGTGVKTDAQEPKTVDYLDLNIDGREWMKEA